MKTKHTPTPWMVEEAHGTLFIFDCKDNSIARLRYDNLPEDYMKTQDANAAHIVKCVNMHDELIEALADCSELYSSSFTNNFKVKIENLLKKAKGGAE